jgi:multidrug efflux pump
VRAMLVPAVTVPVSLIATFIVLYALGFSVNLLTLLALVLAIGLVVDDAIVVLENIHRRMEQEGETPLVAAFRGARQVGFAVIATTVVLVAVFVPVSFTTGDIGRLLSEFALTMAAAVGFSSFVALSLSPMMASKVLHPEEAKSILVRASDRVFATMQRAYKATLALALRAPIVVLLLFVATFGAAYWIFERVPTEFAPKEDRGAFYLLVSGPEGASFEYISEYMDEIERRMMPLVESGEVTRLLVRAPRGFGRLESFNSGIVIFVLEDWAERRPGWDVMADVRSRVADLPGVRAFPVMRQGFGGRLSKPVQFVIGGGTYEELAAWRDILLEEIERDNPGLEAIDHDYKETKPQLTVRIDRDRAGDLGVNVRNVGRTLETILGGRSVTTYIEEGEEYDVILEGARSGQRTPTDINNIYLRSDRSGELVPLANLVSIDDYAGPSVLNRYNRLRAITIEANLAEGYTLGEALVYLEGLARDRLPETAIIDYKGQSRDLKTAGSSLGFVFVLGLVVVFLVLAAQFESFVHPFVIMLTVPLAVAGALLGMYLTGGTINVYTQIGLIMLVGLAAKNGILIVEFVNQLREQGYAFRDAIVEASTIRFRPILMTSITTIAGSVPLILASGAGAETRQAIGVVIFSGVLAATAFTLFVVPVAYDLLARRTTARDATARRLDGELADREAPDRATRRFAAGRRDAAE